MVYMLSLPLTFGILTLTTLVYYYLIAAVHIYLLKQANWRRDFITRLWTLITFMWYVRIFIWLLWVAVAVVGLLFPKLGLKNRGWWTLWFDPFDQYTSAMGEQYLREVYGNLGSEVFQRITLASQERQQAREQFSRLAIGFITLFIGIPAVGLIILVSLGVAIDWLLLPELSGIGAQPTSLVVNNTPTLEEALDDILLEAFYEERGLIDEYYPRISYDITGDALAFYVVPSLADLDEAFELSTDLLFYGALALRESGVSKQWITVYQWDSADVWVRFYIDAPFMVQWIEGLDQEPDLSEFYNHIQTDASPILEAPPQQVPTRIPDDIYADGRQCISYTVAVKHIGEYTCVYGIVTHTHDSSNASFIDFDSSYDSFYLVSFTTKFEGWGLEGHCLAAVGSIETYNGRPEMVIIYPDTQLFSCD